MTNAVFVFGWLVEMIVACRRRFGSLGINREIVEGRIGFGQELATGIAQLFRSVEQSFAQLFQGRVAREDSANLLSLRHQGPGLIADERLRHFKPKFTPFSNTGE